MQDSSFKFVPVSYGILNLMVYCPLDQMMSVKSSEKFLIIKYCTSEEHVINGHSFLRNLFELKHSFCAEQYMHIQMIDPCSGLYYTQEIRNIFLL